MAEARCLHLNRTSGVIQSDLSRPAEKSSVYSVQFVAGICENCGQVELYCDSHREVRVWLTSADLTRKKQ
jgi:hypothetical protein